LIYPEPGEVGSGVSRPERRILGVFLKKQGFTIRHFYYNASGFNKTANTRHQEKVPQGHAWWLIGGYLTRGVCTATAVVNFNTKDNVTRRRLLVLASGASDTTDIPDNVARIRESEIMEEAGYIDILFGGAQNTDSLFSISVIEVETK